MAFFLLCGTSAAQYYMAEGDTTFTIVFCTGQIMKFDMAVNALKEAGIPHQVRAETGTGIKVAMDVTPAQGPGRFFTLLVPVNAEARAKLVLSELPFEITTDPGPWDFQPHPTVKRWWKILIIGVLVLYAIIWIIEFAELVR